MAKIAYTIRGGVPSYICKDGGGNLRYSEHISDAFEFVDDAAVLAYLSGKDPGTIANGQIITLVAGPVNYGKRQH
jgi:hypothetical protein